MFENKAWTEKERVILVIFELFSEKIKKLSLLRKWKYVCLVFSYN